MNNMTFGELWAKIGDYPAEVLIIDREYKEHRIKMDFDDIAYQIEDVRIKDFRIVYDTRSLQVWL